MGSCSRVLPPKKSLLLVKKVTPVESSSLNFPIRFGDSEARLEGPAVRPNVHCFAGVVLAKGSGHLKTCSDDHILPVASVLFHGECGGSVEVNRESEQRVAKASHLTFHRLSCKQGGSR